MEKVHQEKVLFTGCSTQHTPSGLSIKCLQILAVHGLLLNPAMPNQIQKSNILSNVKILKKSYYRTMVIVIQKRYFKENLDVEH